MARDFDGTNDNIVYGSDASIDNFTSRSAGLWMQHDAASTTMHLIGKDRFGVVWALGNDGAPGFTDRLMFAQAWTAVNFWRGNTTDLGTSRHHVAVTYNGSSTTNDPVLYIDGVVEATTESAAPTGTRQDDLNQSLRIGENGAGALDYDGRIGWVAYASGIWDAAAVNRAMWWGRPHGGLNVYHPLVTDKLNNEGSGTANGTATGTTVAAFATPVVRPCTATMGLGVGW